MALSISIRIDMPPDSSVDCPNCGGPTCVEYGRCDYPPVDLACKSGRHNVTFSSNRGTYRWNCETCGAFRYVTIHAEQEMWARLEKQVRKEVEGG